MPRSRRLHWTQLLSVLCLVHGCTIGSPLVDREPDQGALALNCQEPPACDPLPPVVLSQTRALPIPRMLCVNAIDQVPCDDDAVSNSDHRCYGSRALTELPTSATCDTSTTTLDPNAAKQPLVSVDWQFSNLTIHADAPLDFELDSPSMKHVFIRLEGPVSLHIQQAGKQLRDVRIVGASDAAGEPSLDMYELLADELTVGDAEQRFPGSVNLHDVSLTQSSISATNVIVESVVMSNVAITAQQLSGTDAKLSNVILDADTMLLSAFTAAHAQIQSCLGATFVGGELSDAAIDACTNGVAINLYDCSLLSASLDGSFELDTTHVENVRLGASEATELVMFASDLHQAMICNAVDKLQLAVGAGVKCSDCERALSMPDELCSSPFAVSDVNYCMQLNGRLPADCDRLPERERPVADGSGAPLLR